MARKRKEADSPMSRREVIKLGVATGALTLLTARKSGHAGPARDWSDYDYRIECDCIVTSPPTTPGMEALSIPRAARSVAALDPEPQEDPVKGEADRPAHQRWKEFLPTKFYEMHLQEALHSFHPQLPPNEIWGYNGIYPGPTIRARYNEPILVRIYNDLPADHVGFGIPSVITHLHNGHTPSESDGFPGDYYEVGEFKDHHYPNILAGYDQYPDTGGDEREALGTLWYHDHRVDFTAQNVYKGLAGFYLLFDDLDTGNETDPPPALGLPSGPYDIPLVFADKVFDENGQLFFNQFNLDGIIGDKITVNGKIQPYLKVARRKYRFRLLNVGPSRFYEFFLSNGQPFVRIANDGNLLPEPVLQDSVRVAVAERADVIIDFSKAQIGERIFLENRLRQLNGRTPQLTLLAQNNAMPVLAFEVEKDADAPDPSRIPKTLRPNPDMDTPVAATRQWTFNRVRGVWMVNNRLFNIDRVDAQVRRGTAERWTLTNVGRAWSHPVHIHFEEMRILSRRAVPLRDHEKGRKDIVELGPGEQVQLYLRFRDFLGKYIMHCHNTVHEDHAMMIRFDIVP